MKQKNVMKGVAPDAGGKLGKPDTGIKFASSEAFDKALAKVMTLHAGLLRKLA